MVKLRRPSRIAAGVPGVGMLPADDGGARAADHRHAHVETLVVGAGVAGLREAIEATAAGDRVMLVDERHWLGGTATRDDTIDGSPALAWIDDIAARARRAARTPTVLTETTAARDLRRRLRGGVRTLAPVERVWHVRAARVVLATGAHERPIAFADDDRPGRDAGLRRADCTRIASACGRASERWSSRTNHAGHEAAAALAAPGVEIAAIVDVGTGGPATRATPALAASTSAPGGR